MKGRLKRALIATLLACSVLALTLPAVIFSIGEHKKVEWSEVTFEKQYNLGQTIELPEVTATQNGEKQTARSFVYAPDDSAKEQNSVLLDTIGVYEIEYRAVFGKRVYKKSYELEVGNRIVTTSMSNDKLEYAQETAAIFVCLRKPIVLGLSML